MSDYVIYPRVICLLYVYCYVGLDQPVTSARDKHGGEARGRGGTGHRMGLGLLPAQGYIRREEASRQGTHPRRDRLEASQVCTPETVLRTGTTKGRLRHTKGRPMHCILIICLGLTRIP